METITKIDAPKHGTDFLASSHFKIGQEPKWLASKNPGAYRSTFKNDYPPRHVSEREKTSQLPPAQIVHRDMRIGDQFLSITRDHFEPKELSKTSYENMPYALSTTNFKMDADERTKSFRTTNNEYFYEKSLADAKNDSHVKDWTKSHIPQGLFTISKYYFYQTCFKPLKMFSSLKDHIIMNKMGTYSHSKKMLQQMKNFCKKC